LIFKRTIDGNKPGAECDLRCNEALYRRVCAILNTSTTSNIIEMGCEMVRKGNWAFAYYLPEKNARESLEKVLPAIVKKQLPSSLWFKKNAPVYSYFILRALKHAELLKPSWETVLHTTPFQWFQNDISEYGFLVRPKYHRAIKYR